MNISIPNTMRALQVQAITSDLSGMAVVEMPTPRARTGEVLIRVEATALGFPDLLQCQGLYQHRPPLPFVPGTDAAGVVAEVGENVAKLKIGDRVVVTRMLGGLAQYAVYTEAEVWPIPSVLSYQTAAAAGAAYLTAYIGLVIRGQLQAGEWLLVHGAAGGVGLAAVDLGIALGARVIAASTSEKKLAVIGSRYRPEVLLNSIEGFREQVKGITAGGADIIYDPVGGDVFDESTRCIAFGGRLLVIGFAGGRIAELKSNIPLIKGFSVVGVRAGETTLRFPRIRTDVMNRIWKMASEGTIRPHVYSSTPLDRWRESVEQLQNKTVVGRAVILPAASVPSGS